MNYFEKAKDESGFIDKRLYFIICGLLLISYVSVFLLSEMSSSDANIENIIQPSPEQEAIENIGENSIDEQLNAINSQNLQDNINNENDPLANQELPPPQSPTPTQNQPSSQANLPTAPINTIPSFTFTKPSPAQPAQNTPPPTNNTNNQQNSVSPLQSVADSKAITEIGAINTALLSYNIQNGKYPTATTNKQCGQITANSPFALAIQGLVPRIDWNRGSYFYGVDDISNPQEYVLGIVLNNSSDRILNTDYDNDRLQGWQCDCDDPSYCTSSL